MSPTMRGTNEEVGQIFSDYLNEEIAAGARVFILEGLPSSGKSTLLKAISRPGIVSIELDALLEKNLSSDVAWLDHVVALGEPLAVALRAREPIVVEGPVSFPVVERMLAPAPGLYRRIYLKRLLTDGEWLDGQMIAHRLCDLTYWKSIYAYHASGEPIASADLILERVEDDES